VLASPRRYSTQAMASITSNPGDPRDPDNASTPPGGQAGGVAEAPTERLPAVATQGQATEPHSVLASSAREQCPACSATVATDQRYCVDCGQRLPSARPVFMNERSQSTPDPAPEPARKSSLSFSPNAALIAGIGTLVLTMGVGVLIGQGEQSGNSKRALTPMIVTVPSAGTTGVPSTTTAGTPTTSTAKTSGKTTGVKSSAAKPTKTATPPPNPTVKIGQKGSGKGYQHGKFTGHFFGGESEEEAGEEAEGSSKTSKSPSSSKGGKH
jgi:hypothetical protein